MRNRWSSPLACPGTSRLLLLQIVRVGSFSFTCSTRRRCELARAFERYTVLFARRSLISNSCQTRLPGTSKSTLVVLTSERSDLGAPEGSLTVPRNISVRRPEGKQQAVPCAVELGDGALLHGSERPASMCTCSWVQDAHFRPGGGRAQRFTGPRRYR